MYYYMGLLCTIVPLYYYICVPYTGYMYVVRICIAFTKVHTYNGTYIPTYVSSCYIFVHLGVGQHAVVRQVTILLILLHVCPHATLLDLHVST